MHRKSKSVIMNTLIIFLITIILHFLYEVTEIKVFSLISATNESVWEHMKTGFYGGLIYGIYEWLRGRKNQKNFCVAKGVSIPMIPFLMMAMFYTYTGIIGTHVLAIDILITFLSILISQAIDKKIVSSPNNGKELCEFALIGLFILIFLFTMFTYYPPEIPLFIDPTLDFH